MRCDHILQLYSTQLSWVKLNVNPCHVEEFLLPKFRLMEMPIYAHMQAARLI